MQRSNAINAISAFKPLFCFKQHSLAPRHPQVYKTGYRKCNHTINRAAFVCLSVCLFVCLSVCSLSPPRSFDRSSPNLVGVCRWTSELPLRGSFSKRSTARRVNGSLSLSTILYMHQPHATRCNGSSCLQLQSLIRHLLLDGYRTASQQCI